MNARFLVNTVSADPLIRLDQACRDLVDEVKNYLLITTRTIKYGKT